MTLKFETEDFWDCFCLTKIIFLNILYNYNVSTLSFKTSYTEKNTNLKTIL